MTIIKWGELGYEIHNDSGLQVKGSTVADSQGLAPLELLSGSLGLCIAITIKQIFERDNIEYDPTEVQISVQPQKAEKGVSRVETLLVDLKLPKSLSQSYQDKLLRSVERACTVSNTLRRGANVRFVDRYLEGTKNE